MKNIKADEIERVLKESGRTYLCGDLKKDNELSHIRTSGYEIGISDYPNYTFEKAHVHIFNQEYNYIISGAIKIFLLNERQEYEFHAGDLFVIEANEPYVGKILSGTRTIFSKVPGGDDKKLVDMDESLMQWGRSWKNKYEEKK